MNILDWLSKAAGLPVGALETLLKSWADRSPDLAPEINDLLAKLSTAASPESILALSKVLLPELMNIAGGKLDPREHAGDAF